VFISEPIPVINRRLREYFGLRAERPYFRLTWPNDEFEIRKVNYTPEGFQLIHPEFRKVHKYEKWRWDHWILERLSEVPIINMKDLPDIALSYEPIWTFDKDKPICWAPVRLLVETVLNQARAGSSYKKYKHPYEGLTDKQAIEKRDAEVQEMYDYLYGDETKIGDALAHEHGVGFTTSKILLPNTSIPKPNAKIVLGDK